MFLWVSTRAATHFAHSRTLPGYIGYFCFAAGLAIGTGKEAPAPRFFRRRVSGWVPCFEAGAPTNQRKESEKNGEGPIPSRIFLY